MQCSGVLCKNSRPSEEANPPPFFHDSNGICSPMCEADNLRNQNIALLECTQKNTILLSLVEGETQNIHVVFWALDLFSTSFPYSVQMIHDCRQFPKRVRFYLYVNIAGIGCHLRFFTFCSESRSGLFVIF